MEKNFEQTKQDPEEYKEILRGIADNLFSSPLGREHAHMLLDNDEVREARLYLFGALNKAVESSFIGKDAAAKFYADLGFSKSEASRYRGQVRGTGSA